MYQQMHHAADGSVPEHRAGLNCGNFSRFNSTEPIDHSSLPSHLDGWGEWYQANNMDKSTEIWPPQYWNQDLGSLIIPNTLSPEDNSFEFELERFTPAADLERQGYHHKTNFENLTGQPCTFDLPKFNSIVTNSCEILKEPVLTSMRDSAVLRTGPYAELVYQCLKEAPNYQRTLQDIYRWVEQYTDKFKCPGLKGGVRHNLSLNEAFEKVDKSQKCHGDKGSVWRLTDEAVMNGIKPSTQYRVRHGHRKSRKRSRSSRGSKVTRTRYNTRSQKSQLLCPINSPISATIDTTIVPTTEVQAASASVSVWTGVWPDNSNALDSMLPTLPPVHSNPNAFQQQPTPFANHLMLNEHSKAGQDLSNNTCVVTPPNSIKQEASYFALFDPLGNSHPPQYSLPKQPPQMVQQGYQNWNQPFYFFPAESETEYYGSSPYSPFFTRRTDPILTRSPSPLLYRDFQQQQAQLPLLGYQTPDMSAYDGSSATDSPGLWT